MCVWNHVIRIVLPRVSLSLLFEILTLVPKPGTVMATGVGLALPEPLHDEDSRSWFKRFEVCATANGWDEAKKLLRLPTLLRGRAWAVFDSLGEANTDSYEHLKASLLRRLSPDTEEDRLAARERLSVRKFRDGAESIDELARELERLLDRASPGLPANVRDTELRFHLINSLPEKVAFQLKLLPKVSFADTISKAREVCLIYNRADAAKLVNQVQDTVATTRLDRMEATLENLSAQLMALGTQRRDVTQCHNCGKQGHLARNCRMWRPPTVSICFNCGKRGHLARNYWDQGNDRGSIPTQRAGSAPRRK